MPHLKIIGGLLDELLQVSHLEGVVLHLHMLRDFDMPPAKTFSTAIECSVAEPEPVGAEVLLAGAGADFFGSAPATFLASEKRNDLNMFIFLCILYIFLYNK